jgi:SAM-dependent methyltransferase
MNKLIKMILIKTFPPEMFEYLKRKFGKKKKYCPVCKKKIFKFNRLSDYYLEKFMENKYIHNIFQAETFNLLAYTCPSCGAADKDRLYALYLTEYLANNSNISILDIAPAKALKKFINTYKNNKYRTADLYMKGVDDKVDITNMDIYSSDKFDFVICSHVLEHVENDILAMKEIFRILSKTGKGIIMVPISLDLECDYELNKLMTEDERWQHYGQNDHVRGYSKNGFMNKLKSVGFEIEEITVKNYSKELFGKYGINESSVLYIVSKN